MLRIFLLTMSGVLILFFSYKSIIYLSHTKVEATVISVKKEILANYKKGQNGTHYPTSFKSVMIPTVEYYHKNQKFEITNRSWAFSNGFYVNDKVKILLNENNTPVYLATVTHFWFTSNEMIVVFVFIFTLPYIFSILQVNKRTKRKPHPLFKNERFK
jgi:hypothetical protein